MLPRLFLLKIAVQKSEKKERTFFFVFLLRAYNDKKSVGLVLGFRKK